METKSAGNPTSQHHHHQHPGSSVGVVGNATAQSTASSSPSSSTSSSSNNRINIRNHNNNNNNNNRHSSMFYVNEVDYNSHHHKHYQDHVPSEHTITNNSISEAEAGDQVSFHPPRPHPRKIHRQSSQTTNQPSPPSLRKEEDSNDSDESDTFGDYDDLRGFVKTEGNDVVIPESFGTIVIDQDEDGGDHVVQLTDRQRKSLEHRISTFSTRMKAKQKKANVRDIFQEQMKQTYIVNHSYDQSDGNDHPSNRPVSTSDPIQDDDDSNEFKPQKHPQLPSSDHRKPSSGGVGVYSPSNLARFQSQPNLASADLLTFQNQYNQGGHQVSNRRIDALKSQGKNIRQKFKNLFISKPNHRKNFNLPNQPPVLEQVGRRRTASSHNFDDDNIPGLPVKGSDGSETASNYTTASSQGSQYGGGVATAANRRIETDVENYGIEIKSIKYNSSYRKPKVKNEIRRYALLEPLYVGGSNSDQLDSLSDYGVVFCVEDCYLSHYSLRANLADYNELTKNLTTATQKVALLELAADLKDIFPQLHVDVKMPRFKDVRKKANPNLLFGGYLTQMHQLDRKRNPGILVDCPSVLRHMINYIAKYGIQEEGIFRITGTQNRLNALKSDLTMLFLSYYKLNKPDNEHEIFSIFEKYSFYDVAGLLKLFLRELTKPIFTDELMEVFLLVPGLERLDIQIKILNLLMLILNDSHRNSLAAILELLHHLVENECSNKMSLESICTVMAPNLIIDRTTPTQSSGSNLLAPVSASMSRRMSMSSQSVNEVSEEMANFLKRTTNSLAVLKLMINLQNILFHIPPYIYRQIKKDF